MSISRNKKPRNTTEEEKNPCLKEQNLSYQCLDANAYNGEKCEIFFQNYRNCREFWTKVQRDRRAAGIEPMMPPLAERAEIKAEYMKTKPK